MSDLSVFAEALIAATARAFYDDDAVCLIDVLLRDKYLRDDDMGPRLSLPIRKLRQTMQFLQEQHLVKYELVDDLLQGGSQQTKFWYIDLNHAVNVIRLRIFLLRSKLEEVELRARSSSFYLCPGYSIKRCNGRYTETEAQQVVDMETGLFLCQECVKIFTNSPEAPAKSEYTLQLVDNTKDLKGAEKIIRRVNTQLSAKRVCNNQLRVGIYDLIKKVRQVKGPLSSNLPSENRSMGIGSTRLEGTGRTAGIKAKKLAQQGIASSGGVVRGTYHQASDETELNFLKNMNGEKVALALERGASAAALKLAQAPWEQIAGQIKPSFQSSLSVIGRQPKRVKFTQSNGQGPSFLNERAVQTKNDKGMKSVNGDDKKNMANGFQNITKTFASDLSEKSNSEKNTNGSSSSSLSYRSRLWSKALSIDNDPWEDA